MTKNANKEIVGKPPCAFVGPRQGETPARMLKYEPRKLMNLHAEAIWECMLPRHTHKFSMLCQVAKNQGRRYEMPGFVFWEKAQYLALGNVCSTANICDIHMS